MFLRGLSIGAKLLVLPGLFVLSLLIVSGMAYRGLVKQHAVIEEIDHLRFHQYRQVLELSLIHISEPTRHFKRSRMPSSA